VRLAAALAAVIALTAAAPAFAQDSVSVPDDQVMFVGTVSASPDKCNLGNAHSMTLSDARRHAVEHSGGCVAVRGYWRGRELFAQPPAKDGTDPTLQIGLYGDWDSLGEPPASAPVVAVGYLDDCAALKAREPGTLLGYCHNSEGPLPILILSQIVR
jgi:hypothetical protein